MDRSTLRGAIITLVGVILLACSGAPTATVAPTGSAATTAAPSATRSDMPSPGGGLLGLVAALEAAGAEVEPSAGFDGSPLTPNGSRICVDGEPVRAYVYPTPAASAQAASQIDPTDPSHIGTSIVEWVGTPRFWLFDTVLVLYLGTEEGTETLLTSVLGEPFARGPGRPPRLVDSC